MERRSEKSYTTAVCLSGIFGVVGIQHFYLGRWLEGTCDLCLSVFGFYWIVTGNYGLGYIALILDGIHTFIVTIMLLIGTFRDGQGYLVCYPGQKLKGEE